MPVCTQHDQIGTVFFHKLQDRLHRIIVPAHFFAHCDRLCIRTFFGCVDGVVDASGDLRDVERNIIAIINLWDDVQCDDFRCAAAGSE